MDIIYELELFLENTCSTSLGDAAILPATDCNGNYSLEIDSSDSGDSGDTDSPTTTDSDASDDSDDSDSDGATTIRQDGFIKCEF